MSSSLQSADAVREKQVILSKIDGKPADEPLVSVVIPAYNSQAFVHRSIESALQQTHHPLEIIVVDDGSTDGTADVAGRYPVTVLRQRNGGPAGARNTGVQAASGEWIAFLDHDDTWFPHKTAEQLRLVSPGISAAFCEKARPAERITFEDLYWRNFGGNPSSTLIRRDVLLDLGMFDDDPALFGLDDYNLWLKFLLRGYRFVTTPQLYAFTPAEDHYGGKPDKMLSAELVNIDKISVIAGVDPATVAKRKRQLRLTYLPDLIYSRRLGAARAQLRALGLDTAAARYWIAFLPGWLLDLRRRLR